MCLKYVYIAALGGGGNPGWNANNLDSREIDSDAIWVQPKYTCRVNFGQRTKEGHLREVEWEKMLGSIGKR